jgi:hypothetical protein
MRQLSMVERWAGLVGMESMRIVENEMVALPLRTEKKSLAMPSLGRCGTAKLPHTEQLDRCAFASRGCLATGVFCDRCNGGVRQKKCVVSNYLQVVIQNVTIRVP